MTDTELADIEMALSIHRTSLSDGRDEFTPFATHARLLLDLGDILAKELKICREAIASFRKGQESYTSIVADLQKQLQEAKDTLNYKESVLGSCREALANVDIEKKLLADALADTNVAYSLIYKANLEFIADVDSLRKQLQEAKHALADSESKVNLLHELDRGQRVDIEGLMRAVGRKDESLTAYRNSDWELRGEIERLKAEMDRMAATSNRLAVENETLKANGCWYFFSHDDVVPDPCDRESVSADLDYAIGSLLDRDSSAVDRIANALAILVRAQCGLDGANADR